MKRLFRTAMLTTILAVALLAATAAFAQAAPIYADEFNGTTVDSATWAKLTPWATRYTTGELQYYDPADTVAANGMLTITSEKRAMNGYNYTSGIVTSLNRPMFQYGYFEMRAKLPKGQGMWPAFWLTNDDTSEIDIFEMLGHQPNKLYFTLHHTHDGTAKSSHQGNLVGADFSAGFHTFAVDWQPGYIKWYVDGVQVFSYTDNIPSDPLWIVANTAVGGSWPGSPDSTTVFPQKFEIDYIRVWKTRADAVGPVVNTAPVAANDSYATTTDTKIMVPAAGVLSNDWDNDGHKLASTQITQPGNGSVAMGSDGSFTYVPASGFSGTDSFTYKATDGQAISSTAVVTITVRSDKPRVNNGRKRLKVAGAVPMTTQAVTIRVLAQRKIHGKWRPTKVIAKKNVKTGKYKVETRKLKKGLYRVRTKYYGGGTYTQRSTWVKIRKR